MKKPLLFILLISLYSWGSAQVVSTNIGMDVTNTPFQLSQIQSNSINPLQLGGTKDTITGLVSRWYNYATSMNAQNGGLSVLNSTYLFPDTQITAQFGTSYSTPWVHGAAVVLDPTDSVFLSNSGLNVDANTSYTLDSIGIYCLYTRNPSSTVVDTLIVEFLAESGSNIPNYYFTGTFPQTAYGVDTLFFKGLQRTGSFLNDANTVIVKYPLTAASAVDTLVSGFNYFKIGPSAPISVSAGSIIAVTYQFKPGYTYYQSDTMNYMNYFNILSYEENGSNTYQFYTKSSSNQSFIMPSWARFDASSAWSSLYVPSVAFVQAYGFENHLVDFKVSAMQTIVIPDLVITEINYNGPESGTDSTEFIEIYNNDTVSVDLDGFIIVQGFNYTFPAITLNAGDYIVIAKDSMMFANYFGTVAYQWSSGSLSNSGEDVILVTNNGDTVDLVDYDDSSPWPTSVVDGGGHSMSFCDLTLDNNIGTNWSVTSNYLGVNSAGDSIWASPGTGCTIIIPPSSDTIPPVVNTVSVLSSTSLEVVFSEAVGASAENVNNYTGLTVTNAIRNATKETLTLTLSSALLNGVSNTLNIANVKDTSNNIMVNAHNFSFVYNDQNARLLITEIMYNDLSSSDSLEYFEIYNNTGGTFDISGFEITEGVHYTFPAGTVLGWGDYLVIAKDSALVNSVFGITGTHQWDSGGLKNSGEDIEIQNSVGDTIAYVDYDDSSPWPLAGDGDGPSISYCDLSVNAIDYNNDGSYWTASIQFVAMFNGDSIFGTPGSGCTIISVENPNDNANIISMYPNPVDNMLYFGNIHSSFEVNIFDITGSLVKYFNISDSQTSVNVEEFQSGLYFIQFVDRKTLNKTVKKLIVQ
ncbi:MAG: lamin tail domain-containing protein [Bacteroidales bacterium]|nr:lamin tail domain-containing protein [Bacteroidales bacterium]